MIARLKPAVNREVKAPWHRVRLRAATTEQNFSLNVTGLAFDTTYHYRSFASNSVGVVFGTDRAFRTLGVAVATLPASDVTQTSATLNGTANPIGTAENAWFEFGLTTNYGNITPPRPLGSGNAQTNFSQALTNLPAGFYHFRAAVSNAFGVQYGTNQSGVPWGRSLGVSS